MLLTPSQDRTYQQLARLSSSFPAIVVQGKAGSGKHVLVEKFLSTQSEGISRLDLCHLSLHQSSSLAPSNFYQHLISLIDQSRWIYIRHWDRIKDVLEDYTIPHRYFPRYALAKFIDEIQDQDKRLIVTTEADIKLDTTNFWIIRHEITPEDLTSLLGTTFSSFLPTVRKASLGQVTQILAYAKSFSSEEHESRFKEATIKVCGSSLDTEESVEETWPHINLIGMESILEIIEAAIIFPLEFGSDQVPLKKGIVLAGPPGTGKTSIGRWLAHRLRGKLYLVDGSVGVSGDSLIGTFRETLDQAYQNAPAVVFIDDVDHLFDHADTYRAFLTLLDGVENKHRGNISIIATCMDITRIPSSLIRGGRLELCLETQLPGSEVREKILKLGLERILLLLNRFEAEGKISPLGQVFREDITSQRLIQYLTSQTIGWNCADLQRCLDDTLRYILSHQSSSLPRLQSIGTLSIQAIRRQYELVKRPEDKVDCNSIYN
jgi:hypothetical protein